MPRVEYKDQSKKRYITYFLPILLLLLLLSITPTYSQIPALNANYVYGQSSFSSSNSSSSIVPKAMQIFQDRLLVADAKHNSIISYNISSTNTQGVNPTPNLVLQLSSTPLSLKVIQNNLWIGTEGCIYIYSLSSFNLSTCISSPLWGNVSSIEQSNTNDNSIFIVDGTHGQVLELDIKNNFSIINTYFRATYPKNNFDIQLSVPQSVVWCNGLWISDLSGQVFHFIDNQTIDAVIGLNSSSSAATTSAYTVNFASALAVTVNNCRWLAVADKNRAMVFDTTSSVPAARYVFGAPDFITNEANTNDPNPFNFNFISALCILNGTRQNSRIYIGDSKFQRILSWDSLPVFNQALRTWPGNYFSPKNSPPQELNLTIVSGNFSADQESTLVLTGNQSVRIGGAVSFAGVLQLDLSSDLNLATNLTVAEFAENIGSTVFDSISVVDGKGGCYNVETNYLSKSLSVLVNPAPCGGESNSKLSKGAIAGIVIGVFFGIVICAVVIAGGIVLLVKVVQKNSQRHGAARI
eukprot:TRINITY_DN4555_c0_g1_i1.p1 TRINITY_DN4555_c0_g1~~TRINITY_DN4555_c0_g1_i1.p1  ORF type:complete len:523 (+),score=67.78 TRINITY_DN4555_c0_g1_i1:51-1619(+)